METSSKETAGNQQFECVGKIRTRGAAGDQQQKRRPARQCRVRAMESRDGEVEIISLGVRCFAETKKPGQFGSGAYASMNL
jgi:hypothetical protein